LTPASGATAKRHCERVADVAVERQEAAAGRADEHALALVCVWPPSMPMFHRGAERELDEAVDGQATAPPFGVEADLPP